MTRGSAGSRATAASKVGARTRQKTWTGSSWERISSRRKRPRKPVTPAVRRRRTGDEDIKVGEDLAAVLDLLKGLVLRPQRLPLRHVSGDRLAVLSSEPLNKTFKKSSGEASVVALVRKEATLAAVAPSLRNSSGNSRWYLQSILRFYFSRTRLIKRTADSESPASSPS